MTLPNFLIVGAQKAGTTSLHDILSQHPQANMSTEKEINYFTLPTRYSKGLSYYSSYFKPSDASQRITGEATPGYMCFPGISKKIADDLGTIKIVMILRDPIKRAYSQYWDNRRHLSETLNEKEIIDLHLTDEYVPGKRGYFSRGVYMKYINDYLSIFGRDNLHIIVLEDLIGNSTAELHRLYSFLGIDLDMGLQALPRASNASLIWTNPFYKFFLETPQYTRYLPVRMRRLFFFGERQPFQYRLPEGAALKKLNDFYRPWNLELESFLGRELKQWHK